MPAMLRTSQWSLRRDAGAIHQGAVRLRAMKLVAVSVIAAWPLALGSANDSRTDPRALGRAWDTEHVSPSLPPLLRHAEVERRVKALAAGDPTLFRVEEVGASVEGRSINLVTFGRGAFSVLLWSQMHGDEPTATAALFDLFAFVARHRRTDRVRRMLDKLTVHVIPMLNPDGAQRFQRRNAQGIDVNRDALLLQTPEGRALKAVRDRLRPRVGFNLHNQSWRTSLGSPPQPAAISLLAVAYDERRSENAGRRLTKRLCAIIRDALEPLAAGRIGRYDDGFEVRAFGDNVTKWGTPVVLIETGPWSGPKPDEALVRLNFVALVSSLDAIAADRVDDADPKRYESLPMNDSRLFYTLIRNATIVTGSGTGPFRGDVGIGVTRQVGGTPPSLRLVTRVEDIGDLRVYGALETIDATNLVVAPVTKEDATPGEIVRLGDVGQFRGRIEVGAPADLMLLRPAGSDRYSVERVLKADVLVGDSR
jgi:hypothetical protein